MARIINNIPGLDPLALVGLDGIEESSSAKNVAEPSAETLQKPGDGGCIFYDACCTGNDGFCGVIDCGCKEQ